MRHLIKTPSAGWTISVLVAGLLAATAQAGTRGSATYSIAADSADLGGHRATSALYTNDGSAGGVAGLSTANAPAEFAKSGYIGQLYNATGLAVTAPTNLATVNGGATLQLSAAEVLDDASYLAVPATSVAWTVIVGPVSAINSAGVVKAGPVYQNTSATVQGVYGGFTGTLGITVTDLNNDNFGLYAGDGIPDSWQVQYFGLGTNGQGSPLGEAGVDADGTGQTNLFKYIAGLNPIDSSRFTMTVAPVPGQPGEVNVIFSPVAAGRTYTVVGSQPPGGAWSAINASTPVFSGSQCTVTDLGATSPAKFYEVQITYP